MSDPFAVPSQAPTATKFDTLMPTPSLSSEAASSEQELVSFNPQVGAVAEAPLVTFMAKFADNPAAVEVLKAEARRVLPALFSDSTQLVQYGTDVLEEVVRVTDKALELTKDVQLPGDEEAKLRDLKVVLGRAKGYDMSVAENLRKYREMKEKLGKVFGKGKARAYFEAFKADRMSLDELTREMAGDLMTKSKKRGLMAQLTGETYRANLESLYALKERIAILEEIRDLAVAERKKFPEVIAIDDPKAERVGNIDKFIRLVNIKISDMADRWLVGVGMSPMLRAQQEQEEVMQMVLYASATTGMEKVRFIVSRLAASLSLQADVDAAATFREFDNEMTQSAFKGMRQTIAAAAQIATSGGMTEETITVVADEVTGMISDVQSAYANARTNQAQRLQAIDQAASAIHNAQSSGKPIELQQVANVVAAGRATKSLTAGI
jgi:hypothetical protein